MSDDLQSQIPEAVASASYSLVSPNGFPLIFTTRGKDMEELLEQIAKLEVELIEKEYKPDIKTRGGRTAVKIDYVAGRTCPTCNSRLVKQVTRTGKILFKCEKQKWNAQTKSVEGCPFVEWQEDQKTY